MPSERLQRQIDRLLDEAEQAIRDEDWPTVEARCRAVLTLDPENADALSYSAAVERSLGAKAGETAMPAPAARAPLPASFADGRYQVLSLLGEGGKKVVYRARDGVLKREVAFALIKTDGLDAAGRERIQREAELLAQLGAHPNVVTVFDLGDENGQPFIVSELLPGGDLAGLIAAGPDHRLPLPRVLEVATAVARALAFAHGKGVVHRDLKPGNVWLADDGTPKLGDFGLALASAASRLTQVGMVVGTATYMAPEQAMGHEVTPKSDLYSLGCVLYELVTGRPPFVGDENVAIIGQHLNANPVTPSWHRPDCPKPLESLILRLLEKDPSKRPASAAEVVDALAAITATPVRTPSQPSPAAAPSTGSNPVYRRIFVGREAELRQLEGLFDAAASGLGGLVMVVGEPGIGKTTLTEQLQTYASLRGGKTLVGHCYEEGSLSLPYLPFVEALRSYVLEQAPEKLKSQLGSTAPDIARIVSEVRDRVQVSPSAPSADLGEDRYRLFNALGSFLQHAGAVQPLVLVLEDLHDADKGTLELLQFLARQLQNARLLLVGTYRDVEVDRQHPLSATLAELRHGGRLERVALRGLTADEVQRMLSAIAGQDVQRPLAEAVFRQTEGNPLFVQEVVRYLAEEGLIERDGGRWRAAGGVSLVETIPEGLRDVIGKRLSRLSPECNRLLSVASVIGRDFAFETVQRITGEEEDALSASLEEAAKVAVLQDLSHGGLLRYRFAHAFFRQTLYEEIFPARRIRLHQQVARALEAQYAGRLDEHAVELAEHFGYSSDADDLQKAIGYGERAAQRATSVYAYAEAVGQLERCLQLQELVDPDDELARCDLLLQLCEALLPAGEPLRVAEREAETAYALAAALGDDRRAANACRLAIVGLEASAAGRLLLEEIGLRWGERGLAHAGKGTRERVYAAAAKATELLNRGLLTEGWALLDEALATARGPSDPDTYFYAAFAQVRFGFGRGRSLAAQVALVREAAAHPTAGAAAHTLAQLYFYAGMTLRAASEREEADVLAARLAQLAEQTHEALAQVLAAVSVPIRALLDGQLEGVIAGTERVRAVGAALGSEQFAHVITTAFLRRALWLLGRTSELQALSGELDGLPPPLRVQLLALMGHGTEARTRLQAELAARPVETLAAAAGLALLEAATVLDEREACRRLVEPLAYTSDAAYLGGVCPPRVLGDALALLGERQRALTEYRRAVELGGRVRFRPEVALARLGLAELLAGGDESERRAAAEQLAFCLAEFEAMKIAPALERAQQLEVRLAPPPPGPLSPGPFPPKWGQGELRNNDDAGSAAPSPQLGGKAGIGGAMPAPEPDPTATTLDRPSPAGTGTGYVFISYTSSDRARAIALADALEASGVPVWIDRRSIEGGANWNAAIVRGIKDCAVFLVVGSARAFGSPNVQRELNLAVDENKPVLPLLLEAVAPPDEVRYALAGRQWLEVVDQAQETWLPRVLSAVERLR